MSKQLIATTIMLAGLAAGASHAVSLPEISAVRINASGAIFFSVQPSEFSQPGCSKTTFNYVVPASAPQELRDAVLDAAINGEYLDGVSGTGECTANTEILKSITTMSLL
jgi:hypothetical protein